MSLLQSNQYCQHCSLQLSRIVFKRWMLGLTKVTCNVCRCKYTSLFTVWLLSAGKTHSPSWQASDLQSGPVLLWTSHILPVRRGIKHWESFLIPVFLWKSHSVHIMYILSWTGSFAFWITQCHLGTTTSSQSACFPSLEKAAFLTTVWKLCHSHTSQIKY